MVAASVAVLSDIYGVLPALDAVLAEPDVQAADRIVLTGDIALGPQPVPVQDRLLGLGDRADYFLPARASDAEALAVFGPRDGRGHTTPADRSP